jgi:F5/8 type C domain-containing protein
MKERSIDQGRNFGWGLASLVGFCAAVAGALVVGCSGGSSPEPEEVAVARSAYTDNDTGGLYVEDCNALGVPTPPSWGTASIGAAGSGKPWIQTGSYTDTYTDDTEFNGTTYYSVSSAPQGLCVLNAHVIGESNGTGAFDVICQGNNGRTCFWEGYESPTPPSTPVTVLNNVWTPGGTAVTGPQVTCPNCHNGQNAFIVHDVPGHPLNLTGLPYEMPAQTYDPVVASGTLQNPGPDPFTNYPASNEGAGACLNCHKSGGPGGAFPLMTSPQFQSQYCSILAEITNRPAATGGMPPLATNTCDGQGLISPGSNCAAQTDPFVQAMLKTCGEPVMPATNLALGKWAIVSSDYLGIGAVANGMRATDGNTNGTWAGGSIATANSGAGPTLDPVSGTNTPGNWQYTNGVLQNTIGSIVANGATTFGVAPFYSGTQYGAVYYYNRSANNWTYTNGAVNEISLGADNTLWGINLYGIYNYQVGNSAWTVIGSGNYSQISGGDGQHPWVIDAAGQTVYRFPGNGNPPVQMMTSGSWPGHVAGATLTRIAAGSDDDAWVLDSNGNVLHHHGCAWDLANPKFQGQNILVNDVAVTNAYNVWASSSNIYGLFNYNLATGTWQNHCPPSPTACPQFMNVSISTTEGSVWALSTELAGGIYHVDQSKVVNQNNQFSTDQSLSNNIPGPYFRRLAAGGYGDVFGTDNDYTPATGATYQQVGYGGETPLVGGNYWYVDLGAYYNVRQIRIYNYSDGPGFLSHFRINYFNSGSSSSAWVVGSDQSNTIMSSSNLVLPINVNFNARYVMIQKTDTNYLTLAEVQVFGTPATQF